MLMNDHNYKQEERKGCESSLPLVFSHSCVCVCGRACVCPTRNSHFQLNHRYHIWSRFGETILVQPRSQVLFSSCLCSDHFPEEKKEKQHPPPTTASRESRYSQVNIDFNFELLWNCPHSQVHAKKFSDEITHPTQD